MSTEFPVEAFATLVRRVHAPIFFEKLARDYGIVPGSAEEEQALLEQAGILQNAELEERQKSASAGYSPIIQATDDLKRALAGEGFASTMPTSHDQTRSQLAKSAAHDPEIAQAAEGYLNWLAQQS